MENTFDKLDKAEANTAEYKLTLHMTEKATGKTYVFTVVRADLTKPIFSNRYSGYIEALYEGGTTCP